MTFYCTHIINIKSPKGHCNPDDGSRNSLQNNVAQCHSHMADCLRTIPCKKQGKNSTYIFSTGGMICVNKGKPNVAEWSAL
jgi:hypothetical protein